MSLLLWKNILLKSKSCWEFISLLLTFAPYEPVAFLQISLNFWWIGWSLLEGKADRGEGGGDKEELIPPVAQTSGENVFRSRVAIAAISAVTFSLRLCPPVALTAEAPSWRPASSSHLTPQGRCLISFAKYLCVALVAHLCNGAL